MSYHRHHRPLGASYEDEMLEFRRRELALAEQRFTLEQARARGERWNRVWQATQAIAVGVIPIVTFLGLSDLVLGRRRDVRP